MNPLKKISIIISLCIITSCAENLDFDQLDDYSLKPVFTTAVAYFTVKPFQFFDNVGVQQISIESITQFDLFKDNTVEENVVKMIFNAEFKNEFDRDVSIEVELLSEDNLPVFSFDQIFVESEDINPPPFEVEVIFKETPEILDASKVRIKASLENTGFEINPNAETEFEFKSSVTLFIESEF